MLPTTLLSLCLATTATATWTTRSPYEAARQQAAEHHRFMPGNGMQQVLHPEEVIAEDRILTVTQHKTAYRVSVVTEYREAPTTSTIAPVPTPVAFVPSFYRPELECGQEICEACVDWFRCESGVADCFVCKTAPSYCRCNPPADLVRGATRWDKTHSHDQLEIEKGYSPSRHPLLCKTMDGRPIPCNAKLSDEEMFKMGL